MRREKIPRKREEKPHTYILRKRKCRFCMDKSINIDYTNIQLLHKSTTERGKIIPSRFSGACAKHQRKLARVIKRARNMGLIPFEAK